MSSVTYVSLGVGYALSNKKRGSKEIDVYVPSISGTMSGDIIPTMEEVEYDIMDAQGNMRSGKIDSQLGLTAVWLSMNSWIAEAPSIRTGERVEVFTVGDTGKYWWRELGMDADLRRLDTLLIRVANTSDPEVEFIDADNSYWIELSSAAKNLTIRLNKSDNEPFAYELCIDTLSGTLHLVDDAENELTLDSNERQWQIRNTDGTFFRLEKNEVEIETIEKANVLMHGPDITIKNADESTYSMIGDVLTLQSPSGGKLVIDSNVTMENAAGSKVSLLDGDITLNSSGGASMGLSGGDVDVSGGSVTVSGDSAVDIEGGGGMINVANGTVNSN